MMEYFTVNDTSKILGVFVISLILCFKIYSLFKSRNYPPGPWGLPLFGYMFFLGKKPHIHLRDLGKKYNGLFSFYIGPQFMICATDYVKIKDILSHPMTLSRPPRAFDFFQGKAGMSGVNGEAWQKQRRFVLHTMRNLGIGKGLWESMIQRDALEFVKVMKKSNGSPVFFEDAVSRSQISNSISLLYGRHLDLEADKEVIEIMAVLGLKMGEHSSAVGINITLPSLIKILEYFNVKGIRDFFQLLKKFEALIEKEVNGRIQQKDEIQRDDFIGCYLREIEKREHEGFTVESLLGNVFILLLAGHDSTVASLGWLFLLMAKYQNVQRKICHEIDQVIGRDGTVYYEDKTNLPYTMAAILEMGRWVSLAALFPPRYVTESFTFHGYEIPQGSYVVCNAWAMMHDPKYFENPMEFKPERFLSEDGTVKFSNVEGYGPFSFGKRNCPGDGVAIMTIYLYFVTIMQKLWIETPDGMDPDMTSKFTGGLLPVRQKLRFIERE